jgi:hypothetical protein
MSNVSESNITFYISLVSGVLLTVSEVMPYISKIQSNGILHSLTNYLTSRAAPGPETQPLLAESNDQQTTMINQLKTQYEQIAKKLEELKHTRVSINEVEDKRITIVIE